jgi:hypothetical protein
VTKKEETVPLDESLMREVFRSLVERQDGGEETAASREATASQFGLAADIVRDIERTGIAKGWPPLG